MIAPIVCLALYATFCTWYMRKLMIQEITLVKRIVQLESKNAQAYESMRVQTNRLAALTRLIHQDDELQRQIEWAMFDASMGSTDSEVSKA